MASGSSGARWFMSPESRSDEPDAMIDVINRLKVHPDNPHLSTFLLACLEYDPERRADAKTALDHPWLNDTNPDVGGQVHIVDVGDV
mmetsp:Transcript_35665/g.114044  ORF Transcript_35665/g.114044 Transcript_35665/m.114044 type:complete len:87 (+) Transcript_35665:1-261(+)